MPNALYQPYQSGLMRATFNKQNYPFATGIAIGLAGPPPTVNSVTEVANVGSYVRQAVPQTAAAWSYPYDSSGVVYNNSQITFPVATSYVGWVSGIFIADSVSYGAGVGATTGTILFYGNINPAKEINTNDQLYLPVSGLSCRMY